MEKDPNIPFLKEWAEEIRRQNAILTLIETLARTKIQLERASYALKQTDSSESEWFAKCADKLPEDGLRALWELLKSENIACLRLITLQMEHGEDWVTTVQSLH